MILVEVAGLLRRIRRRDDHADHQSELVARPDGEPLHTLPGRARAPTRAISQIQRGGAVRDLADAVGFGIVVPKARNSNCRRRPCWRRA